MPFSSFLIYSNCEQELHVNAVFSIKEGPGISEWTGRLEINRGYSGKNATKMNQNTPQIQDEGAKNAPAQLNNCLWLLKKRKTNKKHLFTDLHFDSLTHQIAFYTFFFLQR